MSQEKEFMLLFRFEPNFEYVPTESDLAEMQSSWQAFFGKVGAQDQFISTHQLGFEGVVVSADHSVENTIFLEKGLTLGGNMVIKADSLEGAIEIAKECPILSMGGNVEVRGINPM